MSDPKPHEEYCPCFGGACPCICRGYEGAIDEVTKKLDIALVALRLIKRHKEDMMKKRRPDVDPAEASTTFRIAQDALSAIEDSIYV